MQLCCCAAFSSCASARSVRRAFFLFSVLFSVIASSSPFRFVVVGVVLAAASLFAVRFPVDKLLS